MSSFWHAGIAQFKGSFPGIRTAYIYAHEPRHLASYASEVDFLKPYRAYFVDDAYRPYLSKTLVWTVNDPADIRRLRGLGAGAITDRPEAVHLTQHGGLKESGQPPWMVKVSPADYV